MLAKLDKASVLLIPATGLIYAAGFLVVLTFLETYGIYESSIEFWKGKYIHIGVLCLAIPAILNCMVYPLLTLRSELKSKHLRTIPLPRLVPTMILLANLQITSFLLVMMARPGSSGGFSELMILSAIVLFGIPLTHLIEKLLFFAKKKAPSHFRYEDAFPNTLTMWLRWLLIAIGIGTDYFFFSHYDALLIEIWDEQWRIIIMLGIYILLLGFIPAVITYFIRRYDAESLEHTQQALRIMGFSVMVPVLYFIILGFAYGIMPYIPATRGGGDYTVSPRAVIYFKDKAIPLGLPKLLDKDRKMMRSIPLITIAESSSVIFFADPRDAGGPIEWRKRIRNRPTIYAIQKDSVAHIEITKTVGK